MIRTSIISLALAASAGLSLASSLASAATTLPACAAGYSCFWDSKTLPMKSSRVSGNNDNWDNFGWDNRLDAVKNNGRSQNNCFYDGYNQSHKKGLFLVKKGSERVFTCLGDGMCGNSPYHPWQNRVSSNKWTSYSTQANCPKQ